MCETRGRTRLLFEMLQQGPVRFLDPPCALCVNGNIQVGGSALIDARNNGCGRRLMVVRLIVGGMGSSAWLDCG